MEWDGVSGYWYGLYYYNHYTITLLPYFMTHSIGKCNYGILGA